MKPRKGTRSTKQGVANADWPSSLLIPLSLLCLFVTCYFFLCNLRNLRTVCYYCALMPSAKTQPARGMRDFLPADVRKREYVIGVIKEVYERYGFEPLETPAVENIETLTGKYAEEGNQLIFKVLKRTEHEKTSEADMELRNDLAM